jgi:hypothetical protein
VILVYKTEINGLGSPFLWPCNAPILSEVGINFADEWQPLGAVRLWAKSHSMSVNSACMQTKHCLFSEPLFFSPFWELRTGSPQIEMLSSIPHSVASPFLPA